MIVLVLQFYSGDLRQANDLACLIADLEPTRREDVRIRLVARQDCEMLPMDTIRRLGMKFDVSWAHTTSSTSGWPQGPNACAKEILTTAPKWLNEAGWRDAVGILMLEADHCPLSRDWLDALILAWQFALIDGAWCMGSWRDSGGQYGHINGGAIYRTDFASKTRLSHCPDDLAWDCYVAGIARHHWLISGLFLNKFQTQHITEAELRVPETGGVPPVLVHGIKSDDAIEISRKWNLTPATI